MAAPYHVIFLSGVWTAKEESEIIEEAKGGVVQFAANTFQWKLIQAIDSASEQPCILINAPFVGSFPKRNTRAFFIRKVFDHTGGNDARDCNVPFCNICGVKHLSRAFALFREANSRIDGNGKDHLVCSYAMTLSSVMALLLIKKKHKAVATVLIVPDLPEYMDTDASHSIRSIFKGVSNRFLYKAVRSIDGFIVLTEQMVKALGVKTASYEVIEGIASCAEVSSKPESIKYRNIVYTGTLQARYGVTDLVRSFTEIEDERARLVLCGNGDCVKQIIEAAKQDRRICYLGNVAHDEALAIQRSAFVLVNPRKPEGKYTQYSFPSKTMEYMLTGRPVLMYKLPGVPTEYDPYLNYVGDSLTSSLRMLLAEDDSVLEQKAHAGRNFITSEKSVEAQGAKIRALFDILKS